jgi:two-component sensor histidine kinase
LNTCIPVEYDFVRGCGVPDSWLSQEQHRLRPNSVAAYAFAALSVLVATWARWTFGLLGADLPFATYFPAVLVCTLVAGYHAGLATVLLSAVVVWWAFIPPPLAFGPMTLSRWMDLVLFISCAVPIVWVAQKYRNAVDHLHADDRERQFLMRELEHRAKNTYAVVESIVRQSLEHQPERADLIAGRIRAVSTTNDIINHSKSHTASLSAILMQEFQPYDPSRVELVGPDIELSSDVARSIALVLHELVTNAAKYGALSNPQGRVLVHWKADQNLVMLGWEETGGPDVEAPASAGFGSRLVTRTLKALSGSIVPSFEREGLKCQIMFVRQLAG